MKKIFGILGVSLVLLAAVLLMKAEKDETADSPDVPAFSMSERLTFSEMLDRYAENNDISYERAEGLFLRQFSSEDETDASFRVLSAVLDVTDAYRPNLAFIVRQGRAKMITPSIRSALQNLSARITASGKNSPAASMCGSEEKRRSNTP